MKRCPACNRTFDSSQKFCTEDATPLVGEVSADLGATLVAPSSDNLPPTQAAYGGQSPGYQQPYQQPYQQAYQPQWSPPQPQQWNVPPQAQSGNKRLILTVVGLVLVMGIGLTVYFLKRSRPSFSANTSSSTPTFSSTSSGETTFSSGDRVVIRSRAGTFKPRESHYPVEIEAGRGTTGTVVDVKGDLVVVKWDDQTFYESESRNLVSVSSFTATIHKSYLEKR